MLYVVYYSIVSLSIHIWQSGGTFRPIHTDTQGAICYMLYAIVQYHLVYIYGRLVAHSDLSTQTHREPYAIYSILQYSNTQYTYMVDWWHIQTYLERYIWSHMLYIVYYSIVSLCIHIWYTGGTFLPIHRDTQGAIYYIRQVIANSTTQYTYMVYCGQDKGPLYNVFNIQKPLLQCFYYMAVLQCLYYKGCFSTVHHIRQIIGALVPVHTVCIYTSVIYRYVPWIHAQHRWAAKKPKQKQLFLD